MKITATILIFFMFVMAFAPCGDASEIERSQQVGQVITSNIEDAGNFENKTNEQQETCSPICSCQCCPSIDSDTINLSEIALIAPLARIPELNNSTYLYVSFSSWSPPPQFLS